ncbi:MAG: amino acid permease [Burkholderiales bacterium]|nr:amino acid permease [Burkholderiales bacterium]
MSGRSSSANSKDLTYFALFSLTFCSMMGSGVFDIPQNIANRAGAVAVTINWIIITIGMVALASSFVYISRKRPDIKSGIYGYAKFGFGDFIGFNSAWGYWLNALLGNASYLIYIFATLGNFFIVFGVENTAGATIPAFIGESLLIWLVYLLINLGIKEAAYINIMITTVKIIALASITLVFCYGFNLDIFKINMSTHDLHLGSMLTQVKSTMLVTVWDFLGIEAACIYALHAKSMRDVGRATLLSVIAVLIIDALISILPFGIMTTSSVQHLQTPSTAGVMALIVGPVSANLIRISVLICVVGALLAWQMLATNILYLSASDKTMPKFLNKINFKLVPSNALLTSSIVLQLFIICAHFSGAIYLTMIQIATSLVLVPYLLAALFAFKLIITDRKIYYYELIKGVLAVAYAIWLIYAGGLKYLTISSIMYLIGIGVFYRARYEQKQRLITNKFELAMLIIIVVTALASAILWLNGALRFS